MGKGLDYRNSIIFPIELRVTTKATSTCIKTIEAPRTIIEATIKTIVETIIITYVGSTNGTICIDDCQNTRKIKKSYQNEAKLSLKKVIYIKP